MRSHLHAIAEPSPGPKWARAYAALWPAYRRWFLSEGEAPRATYLAGERAIRRHMPELLDLYLDLVDRADADDLAARFLSLWRPPPYLTGCSQAVWVDGEPLLVRNYDYSPLLWEATLWRTQWLGRGVLGMGDSLWGLLDGVNDAGLCASLAFGGRRVVGEGFGIPLVLRYLLQVCDTVREAVAVLERVPCHMSYNVTLLDASGEHRTVFVAPDRPARVTHQRVATNHQQRVEWVQHAVATGSVDRLRFLRGRIADPRETGGQFVDRFLSPPTYSERHDLGSGTLYTACYAPAQRSLVLRWPNFAWEQSLDAFEEGTIEIDYTRG